MSKGQLKFARIHLLPAKEAPYVVVIRRKPSRKVHIMRWNTQTDEIEHGSWFTGRIYELESDVSFDGQWMVYFAMGEPGNNWTAICKPPFLRSLVQWDINGRWQTGGVFTGRKLLKIGSDWSPLHAFKQLLKHRKVMPFGFLPLSLGSSDCFGQVFIDRLRRDGYIEQPKQETTDCSDFGPRKSWLTEEKGVGRNWVTQPSLNHPRLRMTYLGCYENCGTVFRFDLPDIPDLLGDGVTWAAYDSLGQLVVARRGALERYTLDDIMLGKPSFRLDLESLVPPDRE